MDISGLNNAVRGHEAYARAAATERLEAAAAVQQSRTSRQMGVRIGKLGISYETEEPVGQDEVLSRARSAATSSGTEAHDLGVAGMRRQAAVTATMEGAEDAQWMRRYGASAYQRADAALSQQSPMLSMTV